MSLPPDVKKKLDGWVLELVFAEQSGLATLGELRDILIQVRDNPYEVDIAALLGVKKSRGRQVDYERQRMWRLYLSWIHAMRDLEIDYEKRTLPQFYEDILHANAQGWLMIRSDEYSFDPSVVDKQCTKFRDAGGSAKFIMDGGLNNSEQDAVIHLMNKYGLKLWAVPAFGKAPEKDFHTYLWALEPPEDWYPAELEWLEID